MKSLLVLIAALWLLAPLAQADLRRYQPCIEKALIEKPVLDKPMLRWAQMEKPVFDKRPTERVVRVISFQDRADIAKPEFDQNKVENPLFDGVLCHRLWLEEARQRQQNAASDVVRANVQKPQNIAPALARTPVGTLTPGPGCPCEKTARNPVVATR